MFLALCECILGTASRVAWLCCFGAVRLLLKCERWPGGRVETRCTRARELVPLLADHVRFMKW